MHGTGVKIMAKTCLVFLSIIISYL